MKKVLAFFALAASTSMVLFDSSALSVALSTIQRELACSSIGLQWVVNAYLLSLAAFVIAGGRVADILGHRCIFILGTSIFALGSALCGIAIHEKWLIASRAIQGIGGAMMGPAAMSLLLHIYPQNRRGKMIGLLVSMSSIFLVLGPFLSGLVTETWSWRYIFFINLPIAGLSIYFVSLSIPPVPGKKGAFDFPSFLSLIATLSFLTVALMMGQVWGWSSPQELTCLMLALSCVILLFVSLYRRPYPVIDTSLHRSPLFIGGLTTIFLAQFLTAFIVFSALFFQQVLMLSPSETGIVTAIAALPAIILAPLSSYLLETFGPRTPIGMGFALVAIGLVWFASVTQATLIQPYIPGLAIFGAGIALIMTPVGSIVANAVPSEKHGVAMGMYNTSRYMGGAVGIAVLGVILSSCQKGTYLASHCEAFSVIARITAIVACIAVGMTLYFFAPQARNCK